MAPGLYGGDVLLARAGWGIAEVRVVGRCEARAWGPYPGIIQCIDAAEVFSAIMAMRLGAPPHFICIATRPFSSKAG